VKRIATWNRRARRDQRSSAPRAPAQRHRQPDIRKGRRRRYGCEILNWPTATRGIPLGLEAETRGRSRSAAHVRSRHPVVTERDPVCAERNSRTRSWRAPDAAARMRTSPKNIRRPRRKLIQETCSYMGPVRVSDVNRGDSRYVTSCAGWSAARSSLPVARVRRNIV